MTPRSPDRVTRALTALASFFYFGTLVAGGLLLVALPLMKLFAGDNRDFAFGLPVPATVQDTGSTVLTRWGPARLALDDARGKLELPLAILPWWFFTLLWTYLALMFGMMLLALRHVRRILQRVRDGAPFDAHNAKRLRTLGILILAIAVSGGLAEFVTSQAVKRGLASGTLGVTTGLHFNGPVVIVALVLIALAEVFRRGSELEAEQSLVI